MEVNRSSVAKYKQMIASVCPDHRLHDIMLYNGADRTGRWSGKGVQPHNFVRGYGGGYKNLTSDGLDEMGDAWRDILTLDRDLITLMWGEPMVCLAKACRGALIASPNKELYAADFNAIEARKLAWLSNCAVLLDLFNNKGDPYLDMATAIYERPITKADKVERQLGKKAILGLGYSMGWEKFQATVWADEGIWLEDEFCQMVVKIYRKEKYPEIPLLWRATEKAAIEAVVEGGYHYCGGDDLGFGAVCYFMSRDGNFLHCRLPSGRMLAYLYPRVNMRVTYRFAALNARGRPTTVSFPAKKSVPQHRVRWHAEKMAEKQFKTLLPDAPESFLSPHLSFTGRDTYTKQWKRCGTHGGSLVENYDQASSRDLLAEAMFYIDELPEFDLLLSIHDEVIAEAAKGTCNVGEFEALVVRGAQAKWAQGMPITAEGWIGPRLRK
jgi:DNA polymerase